VLPDLCDDSPRLEPDEAVALAELQAQDLARPRTGSDQDLCLCPENGWQAYKQIALPSVGWRSFLFRLFELRIFLLHELRHQAPFNAQRSRLAGDTLRYPKGSGLIQFDRGLQTCQAG
jgi:hypothetical protein